MSGSFYSHNHVALYFGLGEVQLARIKSSMAGWRSAGVEEYLSESKFTDSRRGGDALEATFYNIAVK